MSLSEVIFEKPSCKLKFLQRGGFYTPNFFECKTVDEVLKTYTDYMTHEREELSYDIDGLVQEVDDFDAQEELGWNPNGLIPKFATAIKFDSIGATTKLIDIRWTAGTTGRIIPTGIFEPVDIMGVTVQKASLHNYEMVEKLIKQNAMKIGSAVIIVRSGDVIPQVFAVRSSDETCQDIEIIKNCPECGYELTRFSVDLTCENSSCPAKVKGLFTNMFDTLDIKGLSEQFVVKVTEMYNISTLDQLMRLTVKDLENLPGFATKSAQKAYEALHSVKDVSPEQFFALLNIPNQGVRVFDNILSQYPMEKLLDKNFKPSDIFDVDGVAEKTANAIHAGIQANLDRIRENAKWFNIVEKPIVLTNANHKLSMVGKSFCITGALSHGTRSVYETKIKNAGGKIASVTRDLDYLVTNDTATTSTKMQKAMTINALNDLAKTVKQILIISEEDLIKMME